MPTYEEQIAAIVAGSREEIDADLATARQAREQALGGLEEAERRINTLEAILAMSSSPAPSAPAEGRVTLHEAMRKVLQTAPDRRMLAAEIAAHIDRRGLYKMRDGRPVEAQQIHARVGHYPEMFDRDGTFIVLV
jgi:hypothetical protein